VGHLLKLLIMTITEMHIGIDLALQRQNSNLYGNLESEEKDYAINRTIRQLVSAVLNEENNKIFNAISFEDIKKYYQV